MKKIILLLTLIAFSYSGEQWEYLLGKFNSKNGFLIIGLTDNKDKLFNKYTTLIDKNFNYMNIKSNYALATIRSEIKHRTLKNLNIIDLRLFSFFSRFINLDAKFLMCEVISSIMQNKKFLTDETDIYRDYIHPKDLFLYVKKCMAKDSLNDVFDICSKKPIGKFELLNFLKEKYGLQYEIDSGVKLSNPTGFKRNYYSESRKVESLGHKPEYSSIGTISDEISFII